MKPQRYEIIDEKIREKFSKLKASSPQIPEERLHLSWAGWMFGIEPLRDGLRRLKNAGIEWVELPGDHYGPDLGHPPGAVARLLREFDITCSGVYCVMTPEYDLSSAEPRRRQAAIDYIRREIEFAREIGAVYVAIGAGAHEHPDRHDELEMERSAEALGRLADAFDQAQIACAVMPADAARSSVVHTIAEAQTYLKMVDRPGIRHIAADTYAMQSADRHIGQAVINAGNALMNLHISDSHRGLLGEGFLNLDVLIMALYIMGYNRSRRFVTPNPIGIDTNPAILAVKPMNATMLDRLVTDTVRYFREREEMVRSFIHASAS